MKRLGTVMAMGCALGACGKVGGSADTPVTLRPGQYEVTITGNTLVELRSHRQTDQVCLGQDAAESFADNPLGHVALDGDGCSDSADPAGANGFTGKRSCDVSDIRHASADIAYTGAHTADSFELHGHVSQGNDKQSGGADNGSGDFAITGHRTGDCQG
ncbi:DUF3617 family protein [Sphingomonas sp. ASV193]|uniref:DUF3617 domain-containing protein n=1 Tax=Sphingomonas sp. ASV193 TaxID=3144405 RepID=UPI0032E87873